MDIQEWLNILARMDDPAMHAIGSKLVSQIESLNAQRDSKLGRNKVNPEKVPRMKKGELLNALKWADGKRLDAKGRTDPEPYVLILVHALHAAWKRIEKLEKKTK